ncbi:MAG: chorismate mutase [Alphaproteobacteria bacterium]
MSETPKSLEDLRRDIDRVDDAIHDLIMRRTALVHAIRKTKSDGLALRPGREAMILRRLLARHEGEFPRSVLVRIWREIMGAMVRLQSPFSVAVTAEAGGADFLAIAREEYGAATPLTPCRSPQLAIGSVRDGTASVAIVPLPRDGEEKPWWPYLVGGQKDRPRIAARIPFASSGRATAPEALVIARLEQIESGEDRSFLAVETDDTLSRTRLKELFGQVGLATRHQVSYFDSEDRRRWLHLGEVDQFVRPDDERLEKLKAAAQARSVVHLGGYPVPIAAALLGNARAGDAAAVPP